MISEMPHTSLNRRETIMDASEVAAVLDELIADILSRAGNARELAAIGIRTRGVPLARRIVDRLAEATGDSVLVRQVARVDLRRHDHAVVLFLNSQPSA